jgi:hypothetical protein
VQKRIRSAVVAFDEPEAPVGVPRFQCTGGQFSLFQPDLDQAADGVGRFL